VAAPTLDPAARVLPLAETEAADRARRTFEIAPEELVIATTPDTPLLVALGPPGSAEARHRQRFLVGLLGAMLAIGSAVALAVMLGGGFGTSAHSERPPSSPRCWRSPSPRFSG